MMEISMDGWTSSVAQGLKSVMNERQETQKLGNTSEGYFHQIYLLNFHQIYGYVLPVPFLATTNGTMQ
jgi:hypothetical protein